VFWYSTELTLDLLQSFPFENREARLGLTLATMVLFLAVFAETSEAACAVARLYRDTYVGDARFSSAGDWRQSFGRGYQKQAGFLRDRVHALWHAARSGEALPEALRSYLDAGRRARAQIEELVATQRLSFNGQPCLSAEFARRTLVSSYIHMTSNRLGVTPMEEGYLMHLILNAMGPDSDADCFSDNPNTMIYNANS
jgi:lantibiotic biosynthesis dehydratase-like protein